MTDPEPDVGKDNSGHGQRRGQNQEVTVREESGDFTSKRRGRGGWRLW